MPKPAANAQGGSWLAGSPGTAKLGGKAALVWQRVEDNAFHLARLAKFPEGAKTFMKYT